MTYPAINFNGAIVTRTGAITLNEPGSSRGWYDFQPGDGTRYCLSLSVLPGTVAGMLGWDRNAILIEALWVMDHREVSARFSLYPEDQTITMRHLDRVENIPGRRAIAALLNHELGLENPLAGEFNPMEHV